MRFQTDVKLNERERHVLGSYARTIATSIENARLYAAMREQAARKCASSMMRTPVNWL